MKKGLKITLIVIGALLFIVVLATLLVSPIAKSYVNQHSKDLIGRTIHVDDLHVNVYNGHVAIHDLSVMEENDQDTFARFDTLDVAIKLLKLLKEEVYLKHITLSGLDVNVLQDGSRFNFTSIIEFFPSDTTEVEDTTPSNWIINFHDIAIRNSHVYYADLQRKSHWNLKDLNIIVPDFCIGGTEPTDAGLTVALADGGLLNADADFNSQTNEFGVKLGLKNFALNQVKPYLTDVVKLGDIDGRLGADITAKGVLDKIMDMDIQGSVTLNNLDVEDQKSNKLLTLNSVKVKAKEIILSKNLFNIESVTLSGLTSRYDMYPEGRNNFTPILIPASEKPASTTETEQPAEKSTTPPMDLRIGKLNLEDINFTYADHTLPDPFSFAVKQIHVESENLTLSGENTARISAALPNGGRAMIRWSGNISDWKKNQNLNLNITNLHLTDLSPYLVAYLGQPFTNGTFSFRSSNHITNSNLNGKNYIDIYKAEVGDRRKDVEPQMKLPLKAALYIIKDKDDKIQLDVPISGNIDNPEFNYMKLVWKTLGNLIVKVATSPFKALCNALGINSDDLEFIAIDPSQRGFTSEQFYQMDQIADVLQKNPTLHVTMEQQLLPDTEEAFLQMAGFRNEMVKKHMTDLGISENQFSVRNASDTVTVKKNGYAVIATLEEAE